LAEELKLDPQKAEILAMFRARFGQGSVVPTMVIHPSQMKSPLFSLEITAPDDGMFITAAHEGVTKPGYICAIGGTACYLRISGNATERTANKICAEVRLAAWAENGERILSELALILEDIREGREVEEVKVEAVKVEGTTVETVKKIKVAKAETAIPVSPKLKELEKNLNVLAAHSTKGNYGYVCDIEEGKLRVYISSPKSHTYMDFLAKPEMFRLALTGVGINYDIVRFSDNGLKSSWYEIALEMRDEFIEGNYIAGLTRKLHFCFVRIGAEMEVAYRNVLNAHAANLEGKKLVPFDDDLGLELVSTYYRSFAENEPRAMEEVVTEYRSSSKVFVMNTGEYAPYEALKHEFLSEILTDMKPRLLELGFIAYVGSDRELYLKPLGGSEYDYRANFRPVCQMIITNMEECLASLDLKWSIEDQMRLVDMAVALNRENRLDVNSSYIPDCNQDGFFINILVEKTLGYPNFQATAEMYAYSLDRTGTDFTIVEVENREDCKDFVVRLQLKDRYMAGNKLEVVAARINKDMREIGQEASGVYYRELVKHVAGKDIAEPVFQDETAISILHGSSKQSSYAEVTLYPKGDPIGYNPICTTKYWPHHKMFVMSPEGEFWHAFPYQGAEEVIKETEKRARKLGFVVFQGLEKDLLIAPLGGEHDYRKNLYELTNLLVKEIAKKMESKEVRLDLLGR
jgi:hypothetical protein